MADTQKQICDYQIEDSSHKEAKQFLSHQQEPSTAAANPDAVGFWQNFGGAGAQIPAGSALYNKAVSDQYGKEWAKHYSVKPNEDKGYQVPNWNDPVHVITKRKLYWTIGSWFMQNNMLRSQQLGIATKLYALLPVYEPGNDPHASFYPAADVPCKRKLSQVERQSRVVFSGTGSTMVRKCH
jgi:hypothetical protein